MTLFKKHKERKQKRKANTGRFEQLLVGGEQVKATNFYLHSSNDGKQYIEIAAENEIPQLHFENVDITLVMQTQKLQINADFVEAFQKSKFKVYRFVIRDFKEYYI